MKKSFWKRAATLVCALTLCVVGLTAHNTAQAAGLAQTKKLSVTVEENQVKLKWNKVTGAKQYQIYRATSENGTYTRVKTTSSRSWTDTGRKGEYWYKVRAVNGRKTGAFSAKNHTFRIYAKITSFSGGVFKVKVTNPSTKKTIYFIPGSGCAAATIVDKRTGSYRTLTAALTSSKVVSVGRNSSKTISIRVPGLTSLNRSIEEPMAIATFCTSKTNPKYVYAVGAAYTSSYTMIDKEKI